MNQKKYDELRNRMIEISLRVPRGAHNRVADECNIVIQWSIQIRKNKDKNTTATDKNVELMIKMHHYYSEELKTHLKDISNLNVSFVEIIIKKIEPII